MHLRALSPKPLPADYAGPGNPVPEGFVSVRGKLVGPFEHPGAAARFSDLMGRRRDLSVASARDVFEGAVGGDEIMLVDPAALALDMHPFTPIEDVGVDDDNGDVVFLGRRAHFRGPDDLVLVQDADWSLPTRQLPRKVAPPARIGIGAGMLHEPSLPHAGGRLHILERREHPRFLIIWRRDGRQAVDLPVVSGHGQLRHATDRLRLAAETFQPHKNDNRVHRSRLPADYQRQAVYRLEAQIGNRLSRPYETIPSIEAAQSFVDEMFAELDLPRPPTVSMGRSNLERAYFSQLTGIVMVRSDRGLSRTTLIHEAAHAIADRITRDEPGHGPTFAGVLIGLLARHDRLDRDAMLDIARELRVDVDETAIERVLGSAPSQALSM